MIRYRPMLLSDIDAGLKLCRLAGWNQLESDWRIFLGLNQQGCRAAVNEDGIVVGTVTTIRYEDHFSWIGMVLVDPEVRKSGIGTQLLREALQILHDEETIKLDATPAGREVYLKLNFVDECPLSRMHITFIDPDKLPGAKAMAIQQKDLSNMIKLDREVFGADRQYLLHRLFTGSPDLAFLLYDREHIKGYCLGRTGYNYTHIGPVVAHELHDAVVLVSSALRNCAGNQVIIDINHQSSEWIQWLVSIGFVEQRQFVRMYRGTNRYPGKAEKQFAILGPEFG